jgi:hypothetical protein
LIFVGFDLFFIDYYLVEVCYLVWFFVGALLWQLAIRVFVFFILFKILVVIVGVVFCFLAIWVDRCFSMILSFCVVGCLYLIRVFWFIKGRVIDFVLDSLFCVVIVRCCIYVLVYFVFFMG